MAESVWDSIWGGVGDYFSDADTYKDLIAALLQSDPKIKTGKMKEILQMQQPFNFQNISTPLGQSQTTFDPETGQPTTIRSIPQSSLNFLNSKMKQLSEGGWNNYDAPQGFKDYGTGLLNARKLASGTGGVDLMDFTVSEAGTLLIGHDKRLPLPAWMQDFERFEDQKIGHKGAQGSVQLKDTELLFYSRKLEQNESVTLGSNREEGNDDGRMYIVIFVPESVSGV